MNWYFWGGGSEEGARAAAETLVRRFPGTELSRSVAVVYGKLNLLVLTEMNRKRGEFWHFCTRSTWGYVFSFFVRRAKRADT